MKRTVTHSDNLNTVKHSGFKCVGRDSNGKTVIKIAQETTLNFEKLFKKTISDQNEQDNEENSDNSDAEEDNSIGKKPPGIKKHVFVSTIDPAGVCIEDPRFVYVCKDLARVEDFSSYVMKPPAATDVLTFKKILKTVHEFYPKLDMKCNTSFDQTAVMTNPVQLTHLPTLGHLRAAMSIFRDSFRCSAFYRLCVLLSYRDVENLTDAKCTALLAACEAFERDANFDVFVPFLFSRKLLLNRLPYPMPPVVQQAMQVWAEWTSVLGGGENRWIWTSDRLATDMRLATFSEVTVYMCDTAGVLVRLATEGQYMSSTMHAALVNFNTSFDKLRVILINGTARDAFFDMVRRCDEAGQPAPAAADRLLIVGSNHADVTTAACFIGGCIVMRLDAILAHSHKRRLWTDLCTYKCITIDGAHFIPIADLSRLLVLLVSSGVTSPVYMCGVCISPRHCLPGGSVFPHVFISRLPSAWRSMQLKSDYWSTKLATMRNVKILPVQNMESVLATCLLKAETIDRHAIVVYSNSTPSSWFSSITSGTAVSVGDLVVRRSTGGQGVLESMCIMYPATCVTPLDSVDPQSRDFVHLLDLVYYRLRGDPAQYCLGAEPITRCLPVNINAQTFVPWKRCVFIIGGERITSSELLLAVYLASEPRSKLLILANPKFAEHPCIFPVNVMYNHVSSTMPVTPV